MWEYQVESRDTMWRENLGGSSKAVEGQRWQWLSGSSAGAASLQYIHHSLHAPSGSFFPCLWPWQLVHGFASWSQAVPSVFIISGWDEKGTRHGKLGECWQRPDRVFLIKTCWLRSFVIKLGSSIIALESFRMVEVWCGVIKTCYTALWNTWIWLVDCSIRQADV